eukprot:GHVU01195557.1.p1 GENE.GHVU01195557.1~~GHVU01195557.1.p1  ORF type:complete len:180 (-),score=11.35 GHVU01195557.1:119-658(-)
MHHFDCMFLWLIGLAKFMKCLSLISGTMFQEKSILTRGQTPKSLDHNKWFYGPEFLSTYKGEWDIQEVVSDLSLNDPEVKSKQICDTGLCTVTAKQHPIDKLVDYYSSWYKMKRALCWLRRFMEILKGNRQNVGKLLTVDELRSAEISIVKHAQSQTYENEIKRLSKGEQVSIYIGVVV